MRSVTCIIPNFIHTTANKCQHGIPKCLYPIFWAVFMVHGWALHISTVLYNGEDVKTSRHGCLFWS